MIPYLVQSNLSSEQHKNCCQRFGYSAEWDRSVRENVWRRHQEDKNKEASGWKIGDHRRRLVHFKDKYGLQGNDFYLTSTYLFLSLKLPKKELRLYQEKICDTWRQSNTLQLKMVESKVHIADMQHGRETPPDYSNLDVWLYSEPVSDRVLDKPWKILKTGIRERRPAGRPTTINRADLEQFFPAQIELGCGPSIETGIPPLNYFHNLFSLQKNGKFVFAADDDQLLDVFSDPAEWYSRAVVMHRQCLLAEPSPFYHKLKCLHDEGRIVGPILNNNFDGLPLSVGLEEFSLRQYDEDGLYPSIKFHPNAKSLIVIGSHADRRNCQAHARNHGLTVVYIDPEGYTIGDKFAPYPVESPQDQDYILRIPASEL